MRRGQRAGIDRRRRLRAARGSGRRVRSRQASKVCSSSSKRSGRRNASPRSSTSTIASAMRCSLQWIAQFDQQPRELRRVLRHAQFAEQVDHRLRRTAGVGEHREARRQRQRSTRRHGQAPRRVARRSSSSPYSRSIRPRLFQDVQHPRRLPFHQPARQFLHHALRHQRVGLAIAHHRSRQFRRLRRNGEVGKARGETREPQDAHRVLDEGRADVPQYAGLQVPPGRRTDRRVVRRRRWPSR